MGKKIEEKSELGPIIKESTVNEEYENFIRLHEDPLLKIKSKELTERAMLTSNPFKVRKMRDDLLEKLIPDKEQREKMQQFMSAKDRKEKEKKKKKREKKEKKLRE